MKCPHCGQEHPDNTKFCPETGQKISLPKACRNKACKNFGKYNIPPDAQFCPECGKPLNEETGNSTPKSKSSDIIKYILFGVGYVCLFVVGMKLYEFLIALAEFKSQMQLLG